MKNLARCLFLLAFLLPLGSGKDVVPCGSCANPPMLSMKGSAMFMSGFRQLCVKLNGLKELQECLCGDIDLTCIGDVFNKCQLVNGPIHVGIFPRFNFNCANPRKLYHLRHCICSMSGESCDSDFLKCLQQGV